MRLVRWSPCWALIGVIGCGSSAGEADIVPADGSLSVGDKQLLIGEGEPMTDSFTAVQDGDTLSLISGPQGGYHVFLQLRVTGVEPGLANLHTKFVHPKASLVLRDQTNSVYLSPLEEGGAELGIPSPVQAFVCPSLVPGYTMQGNELRLNLELETGGVMMESSVMVTLLCPAGDDTCTEDNQIGCAPPE
jgi:hypothetical protein